MLPEALINIAYVLAAMLFIFGLKGLTHPRTAVRGNLMGASGMLLAVVVTLLNKDVLTFGWIIAGLVVGAAIGVTLATFIQMTAMPQMVALLNGFGGGASLVVAWAALVMWTMPEGGVLHAEDYQLLVATVVSGLIGGVTFSGSAVAFGKLQGLLRGNPVTFGLQQVVNLLVLILGLVLGYLIVTNPPGLWLYVGLVVLALGLGVLFTIPIGGADMPVAIALLNSYSGLAAAATGFVLKNNILIIAGSLVGASGLILTSIMCKAMNRSLWNVLIGAVGGEQAGGQEDMYEGRIKSTSADEVAMLLEDARRVVIVPGYGMAVSQAQHAVRDLMNYLEERYGAKVDFAIHPVAGRMPGHMNVLLAEADIPYDKLREMDDINPEMEQVDVAMVIGANDVVNPVARTDPNSPIAGMPIIDVDKARTVVMIKRSLSPGFAGIPNPLFANDKTLMFFSDGKKAFQDTLGALKEG